MNEIDQHNDEFNNFVRLEPREVFDSFIMGVDWADPQRPRLVYSSDKIIEHYRQEIVEYYEEQVRDGLLDDQSLDELILDSYMEARQQFYEWCQSAKMGGCNTTDPIYCSMDDLELLMNQLPEDEQIRINQNKS